VNQNQQRLSVVEQVMSRTIEYPEGSPGVRLKLGEQTFFIQIRRAMRARFPEAERVALYFPASFEGVPEGWKFYPRESVPNRWRAGAGAGSMNERTEGLGDK
jgi:hypothetical protein